MKSDVEDHANRPAMLNSDRNATKPAAVAGATDEVPPSRKKSCSIGAACSRMPMPAVTLQNSTVHRNQNCGVRIAFAADTFAVETSGRAAMALASKPGGVQPGAGTRTVKTPSIMTRK